MLCTKFSPSSPQGKSNSTLRRRRINGTYSRYKEIQETEVDFLCKHLESPAVRSALSNKLKEVVAGEMPHSLDVLSYLVEKQVNTR